MVLELVPGLPCPAAITAASRGSSGSAVQLYNSLGAGSSSCSRKGREGGLHPCTTPTQGLEQPGWQCRGLGEGGCELWWGCLALLDPTAQAQGGLGLPGSSGMSCFQAHRSLHIPSPGEWQQWSCALCPHRGSRCQQARLGFLWSNLLQPLTCTMPHARPQPSAT